MTPPAGSGVDPRLDAASLHTLIRLALGEPPSIAEVDWRALSLLGERERLLGLVWKRNGELLRTRAPGEITSDWQRKAVLLGLSVERQLELLAQCITALNKAGVDPVVLKGAPLAQRLYGDFTVRPTLDIDLYIPAEHRSAATGILGELGWIRTSGIAPEEENFRRTIGAQSYRLEVHSTALDDPLLHRVEFPVEHTTAQVGCYALPAHTGRYLPAYLATHLAKHNEKPILWALDFHALWSALPAGERDNAIRAAHEVGLGRHLGWALSLVRDIDSCRGDPADARPALRRLTSALATRGDAGRVLRLMSFASSPLAALSVAAGRLWPVAWRRGWRDAPEYFLRRAIRWSYRRLVLERPSASTGQDSSRLVIPLSADDSAPRLHAALRTSPVWVTPADDGMEPAVPVFGMARIVAREARSIRIGDVVAARGVGDQCTLQRVVSLGDDGVRLKPDAHSHGETIVSPTELLGVCDLVDVGDQVIPIGNRPYGMLGLLRAIVAARFVLPLGPRST